jgi:hypothetical protein
MSAVGSLGGAGTGAQGGLRVDAVAEGSEPVMVHAGLDLFVTGVRPDSALAVAVGKASRYLL